MKTFLTLLAFVTSLSAYTFVGVHAASCAICPLTTANIKLVSKCTSHGITTCMYKKTGLTFFCSYDNTNGWGKSPLFNLCETNVSTGTQCAPACLG
ncbi:hypothetical protein PAXRUDRAFT_830750 [Paxillus rubicundulus Ve08.2h10]|uniref:Secreted protein n=1 Tax=Paxillus rubicundulus Ve08.2h10 TaxID=930991 RepID=A0A0D0E3E9_9AGAM|nr:hypothetical protein PAXRUDRAFT_830750 [Paxillus rubicundulus Ve08.2h10]